MSVAEEKTDSLEQDQKEAEAVLSFQDPFDPSVHLMSDVLPFFLWKAKNKTIC